MSYVSKRSFIIRHDLPNLTAGKLLALANVNILDTGREIISSITENDGASIVKLRKEISCS
jgi:hypothetical protein